MVPFIIVPPVMVVPLGIVVPVIGMVVPVIGMVVVDIVVVIVLGIVVVIVVRGMVVGFAIVTGLGITTGIPKETPANAHNRPATATVHTIRFMHYLQRFFRYCYAIVAMMMPRTLKISSAGENRHIIRHL